jgi:hypothetical protein
MADEPSYSDEDVRLILKRAGELAAGSDSEPKTVSLSEVERIAAEAGLDTALVRRAAAELQRPASPAPRANPWLGGPLNLVYEAQLPWEVPSEAHELMVQTMRETTGDIGDVSTIGRSLAWSTRVVNTGKPTPRTVQLSVTVREGTTTIRIEEGMSNLAGAMFGGIVGGVGGGGITLPVFGAIGLAAVTPLPAMLLIPLGIAGWVGGVWGIVRRSYASITRRRAAELQSAFTQILAIAERGRVPT